MSHNTLHARTTGSESDTSNDKMLYQPINAVARQTEGKACVYGAPLSFRIDQPLSNCCSHYPSPLESSNNNKMRVWICVMFIWLWIWLWLWMCVCAVAVTVLVVVVVVVVMFSAVMCFVAVVCPLWCAHVNVLLWNTTIMWLLSIDHCGSQDRCNF